MTDWISDGEQGLSIRKKLNSIPNDGNIFSLPTPPLASGSSAT